MVDVECDKEELTGIHISGVLLFALVYRRSYEKEKSKLDLQGTDRVQQKNSVATLRHFGRNIVE